MINGQFEHAWWYSNIIKLHSLIHFTGLYYSVSVLISQKHDTLPKDL